MVNHSKQFVVLPVLIYMVGTMSPLSRHFVPPLEGIGWVAAMVFAEIQRFISTLNKAVGLQTQGDLRHADGHDDLITY